MPASFAANAIVKVNVNVILSVILMLLLQELLQLELGAPRIVALVNASGLEGPCGRRFMFQQGARRRRRGIRRILRDPSP